MNGEEYQGSFCEGLRAGFGRMIYLQKDEGDDELIEQAEYEGEWRANKR